jgi:hypothetical protein
VAFRAVHAQWGAVFAHLPDLGSEQAWEAVWRVRPPARQVGRGRLLGRGIACSLITATTARRRALADLPYSGHAS